MVDSLLSRPTTSAFAGKQSAELRTRVADEIYDAFCQYAKDRGYPTTADCLRELVIVSVFGAEYLTDLHRKRIESLAPNRAGIVHKGRAS